MALRYELGQIPALTLQEVKAGRTALVSGRDTLRMNMKNHKMQLEMMLGADMTGVSVLSGLPTVTDSQLKQMDLDRDLASAQEASYELLAALRTREQAEKDFRDQTKSLSMDSREYQTCFHQWEAAKHNYAAAKDSFVLKFRTLFHQVKDAAQALRAAQTALALEEDHCAVAQLKHEQGAISRNKLLEAQDKLGEAQDKVAAAQLELFSTYNTYCWAVEHGILN